MCIEVLKFCSSFGARKEASRGSSDQREVSWQNTSMITTYLFVSIYFSDFTFDALVQVIVERAEKSDVPEIDKKKLDFSTILW